MNPLLFLSFDIEADGPTPGINSMLSFGMVGFNEECNMIFEYEANLNSLPGAEQSISTMEWWLKPEQAEAWKYVNNNKREPKDVFGELEKKINILAKEYKIIC